MIIEGVGWVEGGGGRRGCKQQSIFSVTIKGLTAHVVLYQFNIKSSIEFSEVVIAKFVKMV